MFICVIDMIHRRLDVFNGLYLSNITKNLNVYKHYRVEKLEFWDWNKGL